MICSDLEIGDVIELSYFYRERFIGIPLKIIRIFPVWIYDGIDVVLKPLNNLEIIEIALKNNRSIEKYNIKILELVEDN